MSAQVRPAQPADGPVLHELVRGAGLPIEGLDAAWLILVAEEGGEIVGVAAIERHGAGPAAAFLLRSVVVRPDTRGKGTGRVLVTAALEAADAAAGGTATVALLTESADAYYDRWGFCRVKRERLPAALSASAELAGACPASARAYLRSATG